MTVTTPGLLRRLAAIGYDTLLVFALLFAATGIYEYALQWLNPTANRNNTAGTEHAIGEVLTGIEPVAAGPWYSLYLLGVIFIFFAWFWHKSGQTLGMQAWRLRLDTLDGGRISYPQALLRFVGAWVSALCFGLGYLWVLFDPDHCSWHDRISRSRLVQLPKAKRQHLHPPQQ